QVARLVGQLREQPAQPRPDQGGALGPADVRRDAERLDGAGVAEEGLATLRRSVAQRRAPMWIQQNELDQADLPAPSPTRIASNEELIPPPQTPEQKDLEARLAAISEDGAKAQGLSRSDFLRTGSGMAAALLALNEVFGNCYEVSADEARAQEPFRERWPKN